MALPVYLAMTAAETRGCEAIPERIAWMACHFSSYGLGLSNLPRQLPEGSILILNDRVPVLEHDPEVIVQQLSESVENLKASAVLLDFQRPGNARSAAIAGAVTQTLTCPVAVTEFYAGDLSCAVFLEAPSPYHDLSKQAKKWQGRELWLEAALNGSTVTVTKEGSFYDPHWEFPADIPTHIDKNLHCHYTIKKYEDRVIFSLQRSAEDLQALLDEAESIGITRSLGLYQELGIICSSM